MTSPFVTPGRDPDGRRGRAKGSTTLYSVPGAAFITTNTQTPFANNDYYGPIFVDTAVLVDQLAAEVTTLQASENFRMGLYAATVDWQPVGPPLADSGSISTGSTGVKTYTPSAPVYLPRGRYLTVFNTSSSTAQFRRFEGNLPGWMISESLSSSPFLFGMIVSRTYAAFPSTGTAWTDTSSTNASPGFRHMVVLRLSAP